MASIIKVKRSTGIAAPSTINYGELALTVGLATHGTFGGRIFAGDNSDPSEPIEVGGKYYTDLIRYNKPGEVREGRNADAGRLSNGFIPIMDRGKVQVIQVVQVILPTCQELTSGVLIN